MCAKRFAFIMKDLYGGGAEKSLLYTADELRKRGNEVRFYIMRDFIEQPIPPGLDIINLAIHNRFTRAFNTVWVEKWQARQIEKGMRDFAPDTVFSCSADKITRHIRHPNVYFLIRSDITSTPMSDERRIKRYEKACLFYNQRQVLAVSNGVLENLLDIVRLKPSFSKAIYTPYDPTPFREMAAEPTALPAPEYILSLGSLEKRKRHDRLLRAYAASGVKTPLVILGKGKPEDVERVQHLIRENGVEDRVIMQDFRKNPYPLIEKARFLVCTSDAEGLPRALVESLLLKTPIVSVDCPSGPKEILTHELANFLVAREDEEGLANAIKRMDAAPVKIDDRYIEPYLPNVVLPQYEAL